MSTVRETLKEGGNPSFEGRGRLDPTVREIAARTQDSIEDFSECPSCGEPIDKELVFYDIAVDGIEFQCHSCGRLGTIYDNGQVEYDSVEADTIDAEGGC